MIEEGIYVTIHRLITALPEAMVRQNPWLIYWKAASRLPYSPKESQPLFEKSFQLFSRDKNIDGQLYSIAGTMEAIIHQQKDFKQMDRWYEKLNRLTDFIEEFTTLELEARLANCILDQFPHFRTVLAPNFEKWLHRAKALWHQIKNINLRIILASNILEYLNKTGNFSEAELLVEALSQYLSETENPVSDVAIIAQMRIGWFYWHQGENEKAMDICRKAMDKAEDAGIHVWDCLIWALGVYASLCMHDLATADQLISRMKNRLSDKPHNLDTAHYYHLSAWRLWISGENDQAVGLGSKALKIAERIGALGPIGFCLYGSANALFSSGDTIGAREAIDRALSSRVVQKLHTLNYQCQMTKAYIEIKSGRHDTGFQHLTQALRLGKKHGLSQSSWWHRDIIRFLYSKALSKKIEMSWITYLIQKHRLQPDRNAIENSCWPWPVKIQTFGCFEIMLHDQPVKYSSKQPRKILEMLKAIIAYPGDNVPVTWLMDNLWADAEGDRAADSLKVSVRRLRSLLGDSRAIQWEKGNIRINPRIVWVDLKAFDMITWKNRNMISLNLSQKALEKIIQSVCDIVKGPFLDGEDTLPVFITRRSEIELRILAFLTPLIDTPLAYDCLLGIIPLVNNIVNDSAISEKLSARLLSSSK